MVNVAGTHESDSFCRAKGVKFHNTKAAKKLGFIAINGEARVGTRHSGFFLSVCGYRGRVLTRVDFGEV